MRYEAVPEYPLGSLWAEILIYLSIDLCIFTQVVCNIMKIGYLDQNFKENAVVPFVFS